MWVYDRTDSILVAMLMRTVLTPSVRILDPVPIAGAPIPVCNTCGNLIQIYQG